MPRCGAWAAVQHRAATGGVHVHVLAARCDLETGKSLNIAPPGWEQTYGPLVEALNLDQGWSRPDDPARARDQQPGHRAYLDAAALRTGIARTQWLLLCAWLRPLMVGIVILTEQYAHITADYKALADLLEKE